MVNKNTLLLMITAFVIIPLLLIYASTHTDSAQKLRFEKPAQSLTNPTIDTNHHNGDEEINNTLELGFEKTERQTKSPEERKLLKKKKEKHEQ
jgi:hypothetical protein